MKKLGIKRKLLLTAFLGYFCLVVQISTDIADRYQFAVYPVGVLIITAVINDIFVKSEKEKWFWGASLLYLIYSFFCYGRGSINYIGEEYGTAAAILGQEYKDVPGIYVTTGDHLVINDCFFLMQQDMTLPISNEEIEELPELCEGVLGEELVVYVNIYYDELQTAQKIADILDYQSVFLLYDNTFTQIYILGK